MLFLLRSSVCIALVASALPDTGPIAWPTAGERGVEALSALCLADLARCRTVAGAALDPEGVAPPVAEARKLRDQPAGGPSRLPRPAPVL